MPLKLLIVDDEPDIAEVVAFGARIAWPDCSIEFAASGVEALQRFNEGSADLIVLDVSMPPPDGFEVCRRIRQTSQVPILMLTVRGATLDKVRAFDLGADDYLIKPFDHLELLARLRALVRRSTAMSQLSPPDVTVGDLSVDFAARRVLLNGEVVKLTSTEYRLLEVLARNAGIVLTHQTLLEQVWGAEWIADPDYIKVFIRRLRRKLGDNAEDPRYIQTEWGTGYRFIAPLRPDPTARGESS